MKETFDKGPNRQQGYFPFRHWIFIYLIHIPCSGEAIANPEVFIFTSTFCGDQGFNKMEEEIIKCRSPLLVVVNPGRCCFSSK